MTTLACEPVPVHGLPHQQPAHDVTERPMHPVSGQPAGELHGRVLLAEDSFEHRTLIGLLLGKWNLEFDSAEDGQVACELAERSQADDRPYDLILMDLQMPRLSGLDATRRLRLQGWRGPIVALTACYRMHGDRELCLRAGCDDYFVKPIPMNRLHDLLQQYLG